MAIPPRRPGCVDRPAADVSIVSRQDGATTVSPPSSHPRRVSETRHRGPLPHWRKVLKRSGSHMKKAVWSGIIAAAGVLALSTSVYAQQTANGTVNVTANVNAKAKLTINGA